MVIVTRSARSMYLEGYTHTPHQTPDDRAGGPIYGLYGGIRNLVVGNEEQYLESVRFA